MPRVYHIGMAAGLLLVGCQANRADDPPRVRYGEAACSQCGMLISEEPYAAALVSPAGEVQRFDDIGCLIRYRQQHPESGPARQWVHDYRTAAWMDASGAWYVQSAEVTTPMGSGIVALASEAEAAQLAQDAHSRVMRFDALSVDGAVRRRER